MSGTNRILTGKAGSPPRWASSLAPRAGRRIIPSGRCSEWTPRTVCNPVPKTPENAEPLTGRRRAAIWTLIVLAALLGVLSITAGWVNRQLLDNVGWNNASARIVRDPTVRGRSRSTSSTRSTTTSTSPRRSGRACRPNLKPLAGPAAGALRQPAANSVGFLLAQAARPGGLRQRERPRSPEADQRAREQDRVGISTGKGVVTLNLGELVTRGRRRPRPSRRRAREDPVRRRADHTDALGPARVGADGRTGDQVPERLAARAGPRAVRGGGLPGARPPARDASHVGWTSSSWGFSCWRLDGSSGTT